jgi:hypothetical protein
LNRDSPNQTLTKSNKFNHQGVSYISYVQ